MQPFSELHDLARARKGGDKALLALLPEVASKRQLGARKDAFYLSQMCLRIFRAGLKHELVDRKWPAFEKAFFGFAPEKLVLMTDAMMDERMQDTRLIRHGGKMKSIRENAAFVRAISQEHDGFGRWLAAWPEDDITGLWLYLKKHGSQLGGNSGPLFLRMVGKDSWYPSTDVVAALKGQGVIDKAPSSQKDLKAAQAAFNQWRQESGLPLSHISRILACTVG